MSKKIIAKQLGDLKPNPQNPRKISKEELEALKKSLDEFGDLSGFVYNVRSQQLIGAHQRAEVSPKDSQVFIDKRYETPTKTGTVAEGWIEINGERHKYREVDVDAQREKAMNIAANKHGGEFDMPKLTEWLLELDQHNYDLEVVGFSAQELDAIMAPDFNSNKNEEENPYTQKISAPIYEPKNEKPAISELADLSKTKKLLDEINNCEDLIEEEKEFLRNAAYRHTIFDYEKIADFYAHSRKQVQDFMEKSALVIIDYEKAIENGFVNLSEKLASSYGVDYD